MSIDDVIARSFYTAKNRHEWTETDHQELVLAVEMLRSPEALPRRGLATSLRALRMQRRARGRHDAAGRRYERWGGFA